MRCKHLTKRLSTFHSCFSPALSRDIERGRPSSTTTRSPTQRLSPRASLASKGAAARANAGVGSHASTSVFIAAAPCEQHDKPGHPECSQRIQAALSTLDTRGLLAGPQVTLLGAQAAAPLHVVAPVHSERYLQAFRNFTQTLQGPTMLDDSTYATPHSLDALLEAIGAACAVVDVVAAGAPGSVRAPPMPSGLVLCRPPGHHAEPTKPMGFCILNTISVAVRHAQAQHGLSRVAIFDFDLHHGNGTEEVFHSDPQVLYISTHQQGKWPYTGKVKQVGGGGAEGATINVPLPGDAGEGAVRAAWEQVVAPALCRFQPDIIFVSAGYDAHWRDPMSGLQFTTPTYHWLAASIRELASTLCQGRCVFVLEGGYHLDALGESIAGTVEGLLGRCLGGSAAGGAGTPLRCILREEPTAKVQAVLREACRVHGL